MDGVCDLWEIRKTISPESVACVHRGEKVGAASCPTCKGNVSLNVFACAMHEKCTIGKPVDGASCCATCADYRSAVPV